MEVAVHEHLSASESSPNHPCGQKVTHDVGARFYELSVDGEYAGILAYETTGPRRELTHTFIKDEYRGRGLSTVLVQAVLDDVRDAGGTIGVYCPVVADFISRHPEYRILVDPQHPGRPSDA